MSKAEFSPVVAHSLRTYEDHCPNRTAILVGVGTKRVQYIPLQENGLRVYNVLQSTFLQEWGPQLDVDVAHAAEVYLHSMQARYYISEEARAILEEIIRTNGASSSINHRKENIMATATKKASTKSATSKPAAKKPAAPSKAKPAAKKATAAKPAAVRYAGLKYAVLKKASELTSREGTWSHFMQHTAVTNTSTDAAQAKVDANKDYAGHTMDWNFLVTKQFIKFNKPA